MKMERNSKIYEYDRFYHVTTTFYPSPGHFYLIIQVLKSTAAVEIAEQTFELISQDKERCDILMTPHSAVY